jgi:hypothetical protein
VSENERIRCGRCGLWIHYEEAEWIRYTIRGEPEKWSSVEKVLYLCRDPCWRQFRAFMVAGFSP